MFWVWGNQKEGNGMKHSIKGLALLTFIFPAFSAQAGVVVHAPCSDPAGKGMKSCQEYLEIGTPASNGVPAMPAALTQLKNRVLEQIDGGNSGQKGYYQNEDHSGSETVAATYFGPTVCTLVPTTFFAAEDKGQDHHGKSCGSPIEISVSPHYDRAPWPFDGCIVGGYATATLKRTFDTDPAKAKGSLEAGYLHGALVQASDFYYQEVLKEIKTQKQITVSDLGGQPSPCATLAGDLKGMSLQLGENMTNLKNELGSQANLADIANCRKGWESVDKAASAPDLGPLRQSAQLLCAARAGIETMFTQLAACEVFARAQYSYRSNLGSIDKQRELINAIQGQITQPCSNQCQKQFEKGGNPCSPPSPGELSACAQKCYLDRFKDVLKGQLLKYWPAQTSAANDIGFLPGFSIGMLGFAGGRKRRNKKRGAKGLTPGRSRAGLLFLIAATAYATGCGGGNGPTSTFEPPIDCGLDNPGICCQNGQYVGGSANHCNSPAPGQGAITAAVTSAGNAAVATKASLDNATRLLGNSPRELVGGVYAQGEAASAGGDSTSNKGTGSATGTGTASFTGGAGGASSRGTGNGAGAGGAAGGGTSGIGTATTGVAVPLTTDPYAASATGDSGTSAYKSGAGGSDGSGASGNGSGPYGHGGVSLDGTSQADMSFGGDASGANAKTAGTTDPEDYFTRTGLGESLFKTVERKYREKSRTWASTELRQLKPGSGTGKAPGLK
jgi:hypothetical protein